MNRKEFFKKLGFGALAVVIAPKMLVNNDDGGKTTWYAGYPNYDFNYNTSSEYRLYIDDLTCLVTQDRVQIGDGIVFSGNNKYVVSSEKKGWYFLEKV